MLENKFIHDDYTSLPTEAPAEKIHPVVFLLQNYQSMKGAPLKRMIGDMEDCISGLKSNEKLARTTDVCIVSFSDSPEVVSGWCLAEQCNPVTFAAEGAAANLTAALRVGLDKLQERLHSYDVQGITHFIPFHNSNLAYIYSIKHFHLYCSHNFRQRHSSLCSIYCDLYQ